MIARKHTAGGRGAVLNEIRKRILEGKYAPGGQVPTRMELARDFNASSVTIQRAMDQLRREGFIEVQNRQATLVATHPPHLHHYALIFAHSPDRHRTVWSRFYQALVSETADIQRTHHKQVEIHFGVEPHADNKGYRNLVAAMHNHQFAGLIFADNPYVAFEHTPLVDEPGIPRVAITSQVVGQVAAVALDGDAFLTKALDHLAARQRRRIGVLANARVSRGYFDRLRHELSKRGMIMHPYWLQLADLNSPHCAENCLQLLFHDGQNERPDGLLITDDNFVEPAAAGVIAAGVRVPADLEIVAHCNFPWNVASVLPMQRLGYDAGEVLRACIACIDEQRQSGQTPRKIVSPRFEDEVVAGGVPTSQATEQTNGDLRSSTS